MDIRPLMAIMLFVAAALMLLIAYLSYRKRHLVVARTMILIMLAASFYTVGYAFEILSNSLRGFKLSLQIEYVGIPFIVTLWLLLVIQFTGAAERLRKSLAVALFAVPVAIFCLQLTNDWHHLMYRRFIANVDGSFPLYTTVKGPGYAVHIIYNYAALLFGMLLFVPMYWRSLPIVRKQIAVLVVGALAPFLLNNFLWFGFEVDLTPFGFAVTGAAYMWGIYRFHLLRLTPLAQAQVFDTIRDGVVLFDHEAQIVAYNHAAERVLPELGATKRYPAHAWDVLKAYPGLLERIGAGVDQGDRFPFQQTDRGRTLHYACSLSFIFEARNSPIGKLLTLSDITELKENEARLRENARLLSELNAFKDKLFTVVAHDIRDPIALVVNLTELLGDELAAAETEHAVLVREIRDQAHSTFHLVDNLLDWYRSQSGNVDFRPLAWNLRQVVRQALSLTGAKAGMKRIRMSEQVDGAIMVTADKEMLDLILRNLLSNAIKFTDFDGTIEVGAAREGDAVRITVSDSGTGIDGETAELLRQEEPFLKLPGMGDEAGKTRFGLVLTREFVRLSGGRLWFDSVPGSGTTFAFTLPGSSGEPAAVGNGIDEERGDGR
ncbi:sensor histidine kinase [Paenibacillus cymbidii]|uniref:sensor histidine kinase n=1 Tax=Paenibacillus cymbidii TaxID=1639034 RepID=UPI001436B0FA|nr:histidine kinase N-terminal 7TM domain-containing protein [Paenibacillus cymbidii]